MRCQDCGAEMVPMITSSFCPNDCDRRPKAQVQIIEAIPPRRNLYVVNVMELKLTDIRKIIEENSVKDPGNGEPGFIPYRFESRKGSNPCSEIPLEISFIYDPYIPLVVNQPMFSNGVLSPEDDRPLRWKHVTIPSPTSMDAPLHPPYRDDNARSITTFTAEWLSSDDPDFQFTRQEMDKAMNEGIDVTSTLMREIEEIASANTNEERSLWERAATSDYPNFRANPQRWPKGFP